MDQNFIETFAGDVDNIRYLVIDFLGDETICGEVDCDCRMAYPWAVVAEVGTGYFDCGMDEYVDEEEEDEDLEDEETQTELISRSCSVEGALYAVKNFKQEYQFDTCPLLLTDAARYCLRLETDFQSGIETGNINFEDWKTS